MKRGIIFAAALLLAGCAGTVPPVGQGPPPSAGCATASAELDFDFATAPQASCTVLGERRFAVLVTPEHAPPINPSPWYAFRYSTSSSEGLSVRLDYLGARHRYAPKLTRKGGSSELPVSVTEDGRSATITLPQGSGLVSGQPILDARHYAELARDLVRNFGGDAVELGRSLDGRSIEAVHFGDASAKQTIVILGRQHPPEVTGSYALEPFVRELARRLQSDPQLRRRYQILAVPLLNPDGVERGHWRANRGGVDLNRDWGPFSQPETRAVRDWLAIRSAATTPVAMIDFHSTNRNLFYVQGDEASAANQHFLQNWLGGKEARFSGYTFTIEPRNANPGSGTAKNWFFECFGIPSFTYEVSDSADRADTQAAAQALAGDFIESLASILADHDRQPRQLSTECMRASN